MSVTIGIFVHNELPSLKRTLASLQKNTDHPYKLIIINDGSDKETREFLQSLSDIMLITNNKRMGYSHCANIVIDYSDSPFILFLDSASYVTKGWLKLLIDSLKADSSHGIAGPSTNLAWGKQSITIYRNWSDLDIELVGKKIKKQWERRFEYLNTLHNISSFCYCFKREVANQIGYFDEAYGLGQCEDIDYTTRAYQAGFKAIWVCSAYVHRFPMQRFGQDSVILLERNKKVYQNKFCKLKIHRIKQGSCPHCRGEGCESFIRQNNPRKVFRFPQRFKVKYSQEKVFTEGVISFGEFPLVSCIMPTSDRPLFVSKAIEYFLRQDYQNKELIVVDDGKKKVKDLVPLNDRIYYIPLKEKTALGEKRNIAIQKCHGQIILHWDDDDWYAPNRIRYQLQALLNNQADLCALKPDLYYDVKEDTFWRCRADLHEKLYFAGVIGGSMLYKKELWERFTRFPSYLNIAEDAYFLKQLPKHSKMIKLPNNLCFIYVRHNKNTWRFTCGQDFDPSGWTKVMPPIEISYKDLEFYQYLKRELIT